MISFINNFFTVCPTRLRFAVLLDHKTIYIVPKQELSACVNFDYILVFLSLLPEPWIRPGWCYVYYPRHATTPFWNFRQKMVIFAGAFNPLKCSREKAAGAFALQNAPVSLPREHLCRKILFWNYRGSICIAKCSREFPADYLHWKTLPLTFQALELSHSNSWRRSRNLHRRIFFRSAEFDCPWVSF